MQTQITEMELVLAARNHYVSESLRYSKMADELTQRLNGDAGSANGVEVRPYTRTRSAEVRHRMSLAQKRSWKKRKAGNGR